MNIITAFLTSLISYFVSSFFNRSLYFFIVFFGIVILNVEVLSLFKSISGFNIFLLTLIESIICGFIWIKRGKLKLKINIKGFIKDLYKAIREDKSLLILILTLLFMVGLSFMLAILSPVNEPDAQGYHALRALFWAGDGFIYHFENADIRCHCMPINSEIFYTWILSLFKNDCCFGLLEFFSYILVLISSYKIMEILNIDFNKRIWALILFSSFANVISQISSTQTDMCIGGLFVLSLYLILEYKKDKRINLLYFSSLALAISFGVKSTGVIGSIPLIIYYLYLLKKDFIKFFLFLCINFIIFSSYNYILNFINYGNFLGSNSSMLAHGYWGGIKGGIGNFIKYIFQFFDFAGFTIGFYLNKYLLFAQDKTLSFFHIPKTLGENVGLNYTNIGMLEQTLGFGVLGFLGFLPALFISFFKKDLRVFGIIFCAQLLVLSFSIAYMIFSIRFIVSFVALSIPVLSITYHKKINLYKFILIFFMIFYMGFSSLFLSQRPMIHLYKEFMKAHSIKTVQNNMRDLNYKFYSSFNEAYTMKSAIEPYCKDDNNIAIFVSNGYMVYSTKYLELNNSCKTDTLNMLHMKNYNLDNYQILLTQKNLEQNIEAINKEDILNPTNPNYQTMCYFVGMDNNRQKRILSYNEIKSALYAKCMINPLYLEEKFKKTKEIEAKIPKYLEKREDETVKDFILWERK